MDTTCNQITLWLRVNGKKILKVKSTSTNNVHSLTRDNGAVIRLATNDKLTVDVNTPTVDKDTSNILTSCFRVEPTGNLKGINSFFGVLLSPDNV